ncbi:hypothetical protein X566_20160 [Afipia sp. P52-10]|uniref:hypothetical protein n=1 Tax=Afipia sp. P52-10 TaxID=1429916 RepID=UPI0003DF15DF|nr:hypothetical protein [Afipia sp. P52-10]ETR75070.1 hypothetical protein X566_20160 [Afipia sp. P52-10]
MAITFPRAMPTDKFETSAFELVRNEAINRAGGRIISHELFDPYWSFKATTIPLYAADRARWRSWALSLKGAANPFLAFDPESVYPLTYGAAVLQLARAVGGAFDGTATVTTTTATTISLSGLPANYEASVGDNVSIQLTTGRRTLHVVQEPVTGSAGGTITLSVEPPVIGTVALVQSAQLVRATCTMRLVNFSAPAAGALASPISFEATEG